MVTNLERADTKLELSAHGRQTPVLLVRADADGQIGAGHVMRCLALAQAWQDEGGRAVFLTSPLAPALHRSLRHEDIETATLLSTPGSAAEAEELRNLSRKLAASWVVLDGYHFSSEYQSRVRNENTGLIAIDDLGSLPTYFSDVIVNPNPSAEQITYNALPDTRLLLGSAYALLRREFRCHARRNRPATNHDRKVLVSMGGADPGNMTAKVLQAIAKLLSRDVKITIVIGPNNRYEDELRTLVARISLAASLETNVERMSDLIAGADLCVTAGGGTCLECAYFGVPMLLLPIAVNQVPTVQALTRLECALSVGRADQVPIHDIASILWRLLQDGPLRDRLSANCQRLVDGKGAERVVQHLKAQGPRAIPQYR